MWSRFQVVVVIERFLGAFTLLLFAGLAVLGPVLGGELCLHIRYVRQIFAVGVAGEAFLQLVELNSLQLCIHMVPEADRPVA